MGYHIDSLDMCFGTQLVDSCGDIGVTYAQGLMHVLIICFSGRNLGALFEVHCVGLSIMNLKLFGVILVRTLGQIDWKEQLRGGFMPYKQFLLMFSARQELWIDSSSHFEGWLYDPTMLALLRDCTSESMHPMPHFQALQYLLCFVLSFTTVLFLIVRTKKLISTIHTTLLSPSLHRTSAPIQFTIVFCVLVTQETLYYLVAGLFE